MQIQSSCLSWTKSELFSVKILTLTSDCPACRRQAGQKFASRIPTRLRKSALSGQARKNFYLLRTSDIFLLKSAWPTLAYQRRAKKKEKKRNMLFQIRQTIYIHFFSVNYYIFFLYPYKSFVSSNNRYINISTYTGNIARIHYYSIRKALNCCCSSNY